MNPTVSVLMCVYNEDDFVDKSIVGILSQSFRDFEFIIVDDASTDTTQDILAKYARQDARIRVVRNERNIGLTRSLNRGIVECRGAYIARLDADDISVTDRLKRQYDFMESHRDVALCGSFAYYISEDGQEVGKKKLPANYKNIKEKLLFNNQLVHSSFFIRKSILDTGGFYNEHFKTSQDYELVLRLASKYRVENIPEYLVGWRVGKNSLSWVNKRQEWDALRARWWGVTKYGYPKFKGLFHICLRLGWLLLPQHFKMKRYEG
ncbi:MAG: hypothetical protein A2479_04610 [Candidatus Magasanikbacteria bacterium RIFOXYC2_FULL_39_8]|nr:MAG: hypothetical protein A2479_04610 [Candidatus Magasanikbacteria bacterium RIFOXYC2_FULL_39_8]